MNRKEFYEYVKDNVKEYLPESYKDAEIKLQEVEKNNGLKLTGITIPNGDQRIVPTVYLDSLYQEYIHGKDVDSCVGDVADMRIEAQGKAEFFDMGVPDILDYEKMKNKEIEAVRSRARQLCYFFLIIAIGVMSISPELVLIIGGQKYAVGKYVAIPMILDAFVLFIYNVIVPSEYFKQKTSFIMWGTMSAAVINIITNYIFIQKYGFIAAAYTTLFAYICYMILHLVISYRLMRFSIIPVSCIALCLLSIVIIAIVDLIFIDNIFVRYLVCFAVVMFIGIKVLPEFVKENRRKAE